jgi:hypothetical protein
MLTKQKHNKTKTTKNLFSTCLLKLVAISLANASDHKVLETFALLH